MTERFSPIKIESLNKPAVFDQAEHMLVEAGFKIIDSDDQRPWGFFLSIDEAQAPEFIDHFYKGVELGGIDASMPLRPKVLGIAPNQRLSVQTHERRSEIWRGIAGHFHVISGPDLDHLKQRLIEPGEVVVLPQGIIHRGAGLDKWSMVAEIWQHTDSKNPSDEDDIVRLADDFGRN